MVVIQVKQVKVNHHVHFMAVAAAAAALPCSLLDGMQSEPVRS